MLKVPGRKKLTISVDEWSKIEDECEAVKEFMGKGRFEFLNNYLNDALSYSRDLILEDKLDEVREEITISERIKRILFKPKEREVNILTGKYRILKEFMDFMQEKVTKKDNMEKAEFRGEIIINRSKE